jgi:hypothetical protein
MSEPLQERTCAACGLIQLFEVDFEGPDYSVGLYGGWWAALLQPEPEDTSIVEGWSIAERCHCPFTDVEREALEMDVAKDYGIGWEPAGLP